VAVELVTADGALVRASDDENAELMWALRGAGGNFGVVCALEFRLHPLPAEVFAGLVLHPAERGRELMALWRDVMTDAPEELSLACAYMTAPDEEEIPAELRGRPVVFVAGMYAGPADEGEEALRALRAFGPPAADLFAPMAYADFQCSLDDPPGYRNWWTAENMPALPDEAIEAIAARADAMPLGCQVFMVAWGGAVGRCGDGRSPIVDRDAAFVIHPLLMWADAADDERMVAFGRAYREALRPYGTGVGYHNFIGEEGEERVRAGFGARNHERLLLLKAERDPDDVFEGNQSLRPEHPAARG
jgi:FAD/FMN-containing dehydrogenase